MLDSLKLIEFDGIYMKRIQDLVDEPLKHCHAWLRSLEVLMNTMSDFKKPFDIKEYITRSNQQLNIFNLKENININFNSHLKKDLQKFSSEIKAAIDHVEKIFENGIISVHSKCLELLNDQLNVHRAKLNDAKRCVIEETNVNEKLSEKLEILKHELKKKEEEFRKLQKHLKLMKIEKGQAEENSIKFKERIESLSKKLKTLNTDCEKMKYEHQNTYSNMQTKINSLQETISAFKSKEEQYEIELSSLRLQMLNDRLQLVSRSSQTDFKSSECNCESTDAADLTNDEQVFCTAVHNEDSQLIKIDFEETTNIPTFSELETDTLVDVVHTKKDALLKDSFKNSRSFAKEKSALCKTSRNKSDAQNNSNEHDKKTISNLKKDISVLVSKQTDMNELKEFHRKEINSMSEKFQQMRTKLNRSNHQVTQLAQLVDRQKSQIENLQLDLKKQSAVIDEYQTKLEKQTVDMRILENLLPSGNSANETHKVLISCGVLWR
ncbi:hypothetical protein HELRODRAFT_168217 [Helobdella robusta]|uniref:Uncharacterized protein n=1 Tax=Helobdella robusta TaxID=6412 RepID=T1F0B8_HELRO|nr:hypothetical protein HELRODRAFT_168217 [Helobdella robusta]ESO09255.1 hypothetical protein HELRODRAFT_168217 [Helobdella robusta]